MERSRRAHGLEDALSSTLQLPDGFNMHAETAFYLDFYGAGMSLTTTALIWVSNQVSVSVL